MGCAGRPAAKQPALGICPAAGRDPSAGFRFCGILLANRKEFTEPVTVSSTCHVDLPLPRSACVTGFDLIPLRARCMANL